MRRRGFIFTLDALLSWVLVALVLISIASVVETSMPLYTSTMQNENKALAEGGILKTFRTVPLNQLVSPEQIDDWINKSVLDLTYVSPDMPPPLQIVATYWALNNPTYRQNAEKIMSALLSNFTKGYKYQLIINNYTSPPYLTFDNSYENATDVGSATMMVSGYLLNTNPRGYVAKAYLTKIVTDQRKLVGIQRVLAGGGEYCSNLEYTPPTFNWYPLEVDLLNISYQTPPDDNSVVSEGRFQLRGGRYSGGGTVNADWDLNGWYVYYYNGLVELYNGNLLINLYITSPPEVIDRGSTYEIERYTVDEVYVEDSYGNYVDIHLNSGIYVEITWKKNWRGRWYISSSKAYTTNPDIRYYSCEDYDDNSLNVNFTIELPSDAYVTDAILNLATRAGENVDFKINGNTTTTTGVRALDVTQYFHNSTNTISAFFYNPQWYEMGFGSGSWIDIGYVTSTPQADDPGLVRLYSVTSEGGTGIYYLNSLFVPGKVTGIEINLTFSGVHEVRVYYSNGTALNLIYENTSITRNNLYLDNSTIMAGLLNYTTLEDLSKKNFNIVIMLDAEYDPTKSRPVRYAGQDYHVEWNNERVLYGYPYSWIEISYVPTVMTNRFYIPMEETYELSSGDGNVYSDIAYTMLFSYYLPNKAIPWYVDVWSAISFSGYPQGTTTIYEGLDGSYKFLEFPLDLYLIRVAYTRLVDEIMVPGQTNEFKIVSSSADYGFRYRDSRAIVHYFLNGYAPPTETCLRTTLRITPVGTISLTGTT